MNDDIAAAKLRPNAGLVDVVMLGAGSAIGSSIFSVLGPAARIGGTALLWAIIAAMVPMVVLAIVYAAVSSAAPRSGASYEWPRAFIGQRFAFFVAWLRLLGSVGMLVTGSLILTRYLGELTPLPATPTMLAIFVLLYALNLFGISFAAKAQTVMMILLLTAFAAFIAFGWPHADAARLRPLVADFDARLMLLTLPLLINLFMGIETATEIGEEVRDAKRNVPLGIFLATCLTLVVYLAVTVMTLSLIGIDATASADTPLAEAARAVGHPLVLTLMLGAAVLCLIKSLNVNFMIFTRNLYVMSRSGVLPAQFARVHERWGTPHVAATAVFAMTCLGLLLPQDLVYLFIATSIPTLLKYFSTCLSAINLTRWHQDLLDRAHFRLPVMVLRAAAVIGAGCAAGIALVGMQTDWRPYVLIGVWTLIGWVYWKISASRRVVTKKTA